MEFKEDVLYEVYTNGEDSCELGYVLAQDQTHILLESLTANGQYDGFVLIAKDTIDHIEYETRYCEKMLKLKNYHKVEMTKTKFDPENLSGSFFEYAIENRFIMSIDLDDSGESGLFGFIDSYDEEFIYVTEIDAYGFRDGKSVAKRGVFTAYAEAYNDLRYKILYQMNYPESQE